MALANTPSATRRERPRDLLEAVQADEVPGGDLEQAETLAPHEVLGVGRLRRVPAQLVGGTLVDVRQHVQGGGIGHDYPRQGTAGRGHGCEPGGETGLRRQAFQGRRERSGEVLGHEADGLWGSRSADELVGQLL